MARKAGGRIEGWREASATLNSLSKAVARNVGKRALQVPAERLMRAVKQRAPERSGALKASVNVSPDKTKRGRPRVQVRADDIASVSNEFGTSNMEAQPFFRPAVDAEKGAMFEDFAEALKPEVDRAVARGAKRAFKKG